MKKLMMLILSVMTLPMLAHAVETEFSLKDFAGRYMSYASTAGGSGDAFTVIARRKIDICGNGTIDFISSSIYTGPIGTPLAVLSTLSDPPAPILTFKLTLTNPKQGAGRIVLNGYPVPGATFTTDFVAGKKDGQVSEFVENIVEITGFPTVATSLLFNKRQF